ALEVSVGLPAGPLRAPLHPVGRDSGGGIRTRDLRVMSPTSYQTAPPRVALHVLAELRSRAVKTQRGAHRGRTPPSARHPGASPATPHLPRHPQLTWSLPWDRPCRC